MTRRSKGEQRELDRARPRKPQDAWPDRARRIFAAIFPLRDEGLPISDNIKHVLFSVMQSTPDGFVQSNEANTAAAESEAADDGEVEQRVIDAMFAVDAEAGLAEAEARDSSLDPTLRFCGCWAVWATRFAKAEMMVPEVAP